MLIIAARLGVAMAVTSQEVAYLLVLAWAFTGIGVKQAAARAGPIFRDEPTC